MKRQDNIIVLHYTRCPGSALMLHTLSRSFGRKSFLVRSAGRYISFFQPLSVLECDLSSSPKSDILTASAFCEVLPASALRLSLEKNAISMFLAEVLYRTLEEGDSDTGLFEWCVGQIRTLDALQADFANFHLRFLLEYCSVLGFAPTRQRLLPFTQEFSETAGAVLSKPLPDALLLPLCGKQRTQICEKLLAYLSFHLEKRVNVRSLEVLGELF